MPRNNAGIPAIVTSMENSKTVRRNGENTAKPPVRGPAAARPAAPTGEGGRGRVAARRPARLDSLGRRIPSHARRSRGQQSPAALPDRTRLALLADHRAVRKSGQRSLRQRGAQRTHRSDRRGRGAQGGGAHGPAFARHRAQAQARRRRGEHRFGPSPWGDGMISTNTFDPGYPRDLIGYGRNPPHARWPGGARVALQFVLNYEEGAENSVLHGDPASETFLSES